MLTLQLIASFVIGGLLVALQTLIAERVHGPWRGIVLTIPSTLALGFFFIGLTKTPADVTEAALMVPAALAPSYLFVLVFALLSSRGFLVSYIAAMTAWALFAWGILQFPPSTFLTSVFAYGLPLVILAYAIIRKLPQQKHLTAFPFNLTHIGIRSLIGGTIITIIVILAHTLGNTWGGLFSAFPGSFTATFVIYYRLHGKHAIPAVAQSLFFPGVIGFILYAWVAMLTFPLWGIWLGTLAAYLATFVIFAVFYIIFHAKTAPQNF